MNRKILIRLAIATVLTALLITLLFKITSLRAEEFWRDLGRITWRVLLAGFLLHLVIYMCKALRFKILIRSRSVSFRALLDIVTFHNLANIVLPFRTGELSYIYLVSRRHDIPTGEAFATLAMARILDILAISFVYPISILVLFAQGASFPTAVYVVILFIAIFFLSCMALVLGITLRGDQVISLLKALLARFRLDQRSIAETIIQKMEEAVESFRQVRSARLYLKLLAISIFVLVVQYLIAYILLLGLTFDVTYVETIFASTLAGLTNILPIHSLGGFGTLETGWAAGFKMIGFSGKEAVSSGLSVHIIAFSYISIIGIYGLIRIWSYRRRG